MWCLTLTNGTRSFHLTAEAAEAAAEGREHVVWFDSFDYELHNPGDERAAWFGPMVAEQRAAGLAYVAALADGLRDRWGVAPA